MFKKYVSFFLIAFFCSFSVASLAGSEGLVGKREFGEWMVLTLGSDEDPSETNDIIAANDEGRNQYIMITRINDPNDPFVATAGIYTQEISNIKITPNIFFSVDGNKWVARTANPELTANEMTVYLKQDHIRKLKKGKKLTISYMSKPDSKMHSFTYSLTGFTAAFNSAREIRS